MNPFKTISFFMTWGLIFGTVLGTLSGTLIFPIFGTSYALPWGAGMGLGLGALAGIITAAGDRLFRREKMNIQGYRRKLSATVGGITAIGAVISLIATTNGMLWGAGSTGMGIFLALSLLAGTVWGALASAYTATRHVDQEINLAFEPERIDDTLVIWQIIRAAANRWTFILGTIAGVLYNVYQRLTYNYSDIPFTPGDYLSFAAAGAAGGLGMTAANIVLLGILNGCLLLFVNRLYFKEYAPHLTREQYKSRVAVLCFGVTLGASLMVSVFVFAPLVALIAAMAARSYADWLYTDPEKAKRKSKEADISVSRLQSKNAEDGEMMDVAEYRAEQAGRASR